MCLMPIQCKGTLAHLFHNSSHCLLRVLKRSNKHTRDPIHDIVDEAPKAVWLESVFTINC